MGSKGLRLDTQVFSDFQHHQTSLKSLTTNGDVKATPVKCEVNRIESVDVLVAAEWTSMRICVTLTWAKLCVRASPEL